MKERYTHMNATIFLKSLEYITGTQVTTTDIIKICNQIDGELVTGFNHNNIDRKEIVNIAKCGCNTISFLATSDLFTPSALKKFVKSHTDKLKELTPLVAIAIDNDSDGSEVVKARIKAVRIGNKKPSYYAP